MTNTVLYEAPGPRARRRSRIASALVSVALLGLLAWVLVRLAERGQLSADRWGPLINPADPTFSSLWRLLGQALGNTLVAAALAMVFSLVIGTLLAVSRVVSAPWYRWAIVGVVELLRGVPVVIAIFFAYRALPEFGIDLPTLWYLVIGLTAYNSVIIAEIMRAGILAVPKGQSEAAYAIGMRRHQVLGSILLPQAFRSMLPALISQLVVIVKDTSLGFIISYFELVRQAQVIVQNLFNPIQVYFTIAVIFILINYGLSRLAIYVENRLSRARRGEVVRPGDLQQAGAAGD